MVEKSFPQATHWQKALMKRLLTVLNRMIR